MFAKAFLLSLAIAAPGAAEPPSAAVVEPHPSSLRMVLNIPSYRLEVYDGDEKIRSYTVTVGMPKFPTPTGGFAITRIEWNPWWTPPGESRPICPSGDCCIWCSSPAVWALGWGWYGIE